MAASVDDGEADPLMGCTAELYDILLRAFGYLEVSSCSLRSEPAPLGSHARLFSFSQHSSGLAALAIATEIIAAVCKPCKLRSKLVH